MSDLKDQLKSAGLISSFGQPLSSGEFDPEGCPLCNWTCGVCKQCNRCYSGATC